MLRILKKNKIMILILHLLGVFSRVLDHVDHHMVCRGLDRYQDWAALGNQE